jgi:hypothetical protein
MTKEKGFPIDKLPFETPTRRVYVCGDFVGNYSHVRNSYQPVLQSVGILHEKLTGVSIPMMTQHIVSLRKFSLTNWTLHVGGIPSPVTSSEEGEAEEEAGEEEEVRGSLSIENPFSFVIRSRQTLRD